MVLTHVHWHVRTQVRTFQQLQLHRELFASMYGVRLRFVNGIAPTSVPINPQRMMELWDYEGSLSHQERRAIQAALRREVIRRRDQLQVRATQLSVTLLGLPVFPM